MSEPRAARRAARVVLDDDRETGDLWVVGGRVTFERPTARERHHDPAGLGRARPGGRALPHRARPRRPGRRGDRRGAGARRPRRRDAARARRRLAATPRGCTSATTCRACCAPARTWPGRERYLRHYGRELGRPGPAARARSPRRPRAATAGSSSSRTGSTGTSGADGDLRPLWPDDVLARAVAVAHDRRRPGSPRTPSRPRPSPGLLAAGRRLPRARHRPDRRADREVAAARDRGHPDAAAGRPVRRHRRRGGRGTRCTRRGCAPCTHRRYQHVRDLHEAGVRLLVGTDAGGTIAHGRIADGDRRAGRARASRTRDVVAAASWRTRDYLGVPGLEEGASADLVVYDADPRSDARCSPTRGPSSCAASWRQPGRSRARSPSVDRVRDGRLGADRWRARPVPGRCRPGRSRRMTRCSIGWVSPAVAGRGVHRARRRTTSVVTGSTGRSAHTAGTPSTAVVWTTASDAVPAAVAIGLGRRGVRVGCRVAPRSRATVPGRPGRPTQGFDAAAAYRVARRVRRPGEVVRR